MMLSRMWNIRGDAYSAQTEYRDSQNIDVINVNFALPLHNKFDVTLH